MIDQESLAAIDCGGVRVTADSISVLDEDRAVAAMPLSSDGRLKLRWGFIAERPLLQLLLGAGLTYVGVRAVVFTIDWLLTGGTVFDYQILLGTMLPLGFYLVRESIARGPYLQAQGSGRQRKYSLTGVRSKEISTFVETLGHQFAHDIELEEGVWANVNSVLPSVPHRVAVIWTYWVLITLSIVGGLWLIVPTTCLLESTCTRWQGFVADASNALLWLLLVGVTIAGWAGVLPGARRKGAA